jgi:N-acetylglucosamine kinase-like BadF-type ATPase
VAYCVTGFDHQGHPSTMKSEDLVLGVDGGGTTTVAWLAARGDADEPVIVGRGSAGASNPQSVGFSRAREHLDRAIAAAFEDAGTPPGKVHAAVLGLAGSDRPQAREVFRRWAEDRALADRVEVTHDAKLVLAAGSDAGWGIALICGTGSLAYGEDRQGRSARAGGWGYLFGDEGSGYAIALAGLRAATQSADGRAEPTALLDALLARLELAEPSELARATFRLAAEPATVAALADVVTAQAVRGDAAARKIVDRAAAELALAVGAVAEKLEIAAAGFPISVAGGTLLGCPALRGHFQQHLADRGLMHGPIAEIDSPVLGAVRLALAD